MHKYFTTMAYIFLAAWFIAAMAMSYELLSFLDDPEGINAAQHIKLAAIAGATFLVALFGSFMSAHYSKQRWAR